MIHFAILGSLMLWINFSTLLLCYDSDFKSFKPISPCTVAVFPDSFPNNDCRLWRADFADRTVPAPERPTD